jgi:hypothetical protein
MSTDETNGEFTEVMSYVGSLEKWLWRGAIRRNLLNADSPWHKMIPKYGREGATLIVVGSAWFVMSLLALPSIVLLEGNRSGSALRMGFGIFLAAVALLSIGLGWWRYASAIRAGRRFRAGNSE